MTWHGIFCSWRHPPRQGAHGGLAEYARQGVDRGLHPPHRGDRRVRRGTQSFPARAPGARHVRPKRERDVRRRHHLATVLLQGWRVVRSLFGASPLLQYLGSRVASLRLNTGDGGPFWVYPTAAVAAAVGFWGFLWGERAWSVVLRHSG